MEIKSNIYNIKTHFKSRNHLIREADDIRRAARSTFPMTSSTYIDEFYLTASPQSVHKNYARMLSDKYKKKIETVRDIVSDQKYYLPKSNEEKNAPYGVNLQYIKLTRLGNCKESAIAALAALCANGYNQSERVELYIKTQYINKKTGEIEYEGTDPLDHSFVVTTMNKKDLYKAKEKDLIIIDPWMGFTDSFSGAKARYKSIYDKESLKDINSYRNSMFRFQQAKNGNTSADLKDYQIKQTFVIKSTDWVTAIELKRAQCYFQHKYPSLIKMPQNTQANI